MFSKTIKTKLIIRNFCSEYCTSYGCILNTVPLMGELSLWPKPILCLNLKGHTFSYPVFLLQNIYNFRNCVIYSSTYLFIFEMTFQNTQKFLTRKMLFYFVLLWSFLINSMGMGKIIVELCSAAMLKNVVFVIQNFTRGTGTNKEITLFCEWWTSFS